MNLFLKFFITGSLATLIAGQAPTCKYTTGTDGLYTCSLDFADISPDDVDKGIEGRLDGGKVEDDVKKLVVPGKALEYVLVSIFKKFASLQKLEVPVGALENIGSEFFFNCSKLETIVIYKSLFEKVPAGTFSACTSLKELDLGTNQINLLDKESFAQLEMLTVLKINDNRLSSVPRDVFSQLPVLETLDLSANSFKSFDSIIFSNNKELLFLSIAKNKFNKIPGDYFKGLTKLTTLDATNSEVNATAQSIFDNLESLKVVKFKSNLCIDNDYDDFQKANIDDFGVCIRNFNGASIFILSNLLLIVSVILKAL